MALSRTPPNHRCNAALNNAPPPLASNSVNDDPSFKASVSPTTSAAPRPGGIHHTSSCMGPIISSCASAASTRALTVVLERMRRPRYGVYSKLWAQTRVRTMSPHSMLIWYLSISSRGLIIEQCVMRQGRDVWGISRQPGLVCFPPTGPAPKNNIFIDRAGFIALVRRSGETTAFNHSGGNFLRRLRALFGSGSCRIRIKWARRCFTNNMA